MAAELKASNSMNTSWLIGGALALAYVLFGHYAAARPEEIGAWAILLAGAPVLFAIFGLARESRQGLFVGVLTIAAMGLLAWLWPTLRNPTVWLYFAEHFGINAALALMFGRTLLQGHRPLVTVIAAMAHDEMSPELLRYTRQVTVAWTLFFVANALVSTVLFFLAPIEVWSVFANILSMPLVGAMFLVENEVRKRTLPKRDLVGLFTTVRAVSAKFRR
jgi:uncharacterized membrane protein